jgi:NADPH:quinone reductase-like Zn-dependent oxidoreductase
VLSTTRRAGRVALLKERGAGHPLLDTGQVAPAVRELYPGGVDAALDLVGTPTLPDTLRAVRVHGTACFGGSLSGKWSTTAPPASSSSASGINTPAKTGSPRQAEPGSRVCAPQSHAI